MQAILLRKVPYGEADLVLNFLTSEGKLFSCFAKSARNSQKRFGGALDIFNQLELVCDPVSQTRSQGLPRLQSISLIVGMEGLRHDLAKFAASCFFAEMILVFLKEDQSLPGLYDLLLSFLLEIKDKTQLAPQWIPLMEYKLLDLFGFQPELSACLVCREGLNPDYRYAFDERRGGIVCSGCEPRGDLSEMTLKKLNGSGDWNDYEVNQMRGLFENFIESISGKKFKSLSFLSEVLH